MSTQDSGGDVTGSSQLEVQSVYSFSRIRSFLQETKGMRLVKVEEYFPDLQLFLDSVKFFSKNAGCPGQQAFTDQEVYRLKKLVVKVRSQIAHELVFTVVLLFLRVPLGLVWLQPFLHNV